MFQWFRRGCYLFVAFWVIGVCPATQADVIVWQPWSDAVFVQAKREHKFVYLDLEAVWCHWCHVMDSVTFRDPAVIQEMREHYIAVRVDQDARPDLAARYENYGWPATVIYGADRTEIVKKQGYVPPRPMLRLLRAVVADPSPVNYGDQPVEATAATGSLLDPARLAQLHSAWVKGYDNQHGGWGSSHKFLDSDQVELALREAARGNALAAHRARETLDKQRRLQDPVWGGVYQYSVDGDWNEPHFEKIMSMQADNLRIYALAYAQWANPADLAIVQSIRRYLHDFLTSPAGAFYVSQDADLVPGEENASYFARDDAGRRARGLPRVDRHLYARENGWAIRALADASAYTGSPEDRAAAVRAANWVVAQRSLPEGGYRHDARDAAGPYLGDTLAMGRAELALYQVTGDRRWLERAAAAAGFIRRHFARSTAHSPLFGFATADTTRPTFPVPLPEFDENASLARFGLALTAATGNANDRIMAENSLRWLLAPGTSNSRGSYVAGILLAADEAQSDPLHIAIVGRRADPQAQALWQISLRAPTAHKLIEFWDRSTGAPPRGEDIYPQLSAAAAFVCSGGACSSPIFTPDALRTRIQRTAPAVLHGSGPANR